MKRRHLSWALAALILCTAPVLANPDKKRGGKRADFASAGGGTALEVGQPAPDFTLTGADGKSYRLADYKDKIVVLEWFNKDCPVCKRYNETMVRLANTYSDRGVVWLAVDSTHFRKADENAEFARDRGIAYPILCDFDGKVGKQYHAITTPHMFVINKCVLTYNGAIENTKEKGRNYVAAALDALLSGRTVDVPRTKPFGCSVKYKGAR